jgi:hypothetical protein
MKYTTYVTGTIDISNVSSSVKLQIKQILSEIYNQKDLESIYSEDIIEINDEWTEFNQSEKFLIIMYKIAKLLNNKTKSLIICNGEKENDIWGIIIENNKVFTQKFELVPVGDIKEYKSKQ